MLCESCREHFEHENDRSIYYLQLKTNIVARAKAEAHDPLLVQALEADLEQYQNAVRKSRDDISGAPCPWFRGDLSRTSWSPSAYPECSTAIWEIPREGREVNSSALTGCNICRRLCAIVSHMPPFGHIFTVRFESWVFFHPISLKPSHIQFLIRRPFHNEWVDFWFTEDDDEYGTLCERSLFLLHSLMVG
jgi:hypothetical protein